MSVLRIKLLGPPQILWEDQIITIPRRNPRAILFYLAFRRQLVSRDEILNLLWPDTPTSSGRLRLNENLSRLRSSLPHADMVESEGDLLGLDINRTWVDTYEFDQLVNQIGQTPWRIPLDQPLPDSLVQNMETALALWHGLHFMIGDVLPNSPELDHWLTQTTAHYERPRINLLERLAQNAYVLGDYLIVKEIARQGLILNEYNENLHALVLQSMIHQGHILDARHYYQYIQKLLRDELQIEMPAKLRALSSQIMQMQNGVNAEIPSDWGIHPSIIVPFVGREKALNQLRQVYNQQKNIGVLGESGSGKTRLLQEFVSKIYPGPRVMVANCKFHEASLPLHPIRGLLRQTIKPEEWNAMPPVWAGQLLRLLPELHSLCPNLEIPTIPTDPAQAQAILMEAIRQAFLSLSQSQSLFLILDDAHWADAATLSTLFYLHSRAPFNQDSCIAVLARQEELSSSLEQMALAIQDDKRMAVIRLPGLQEEDIAMLARFVVRKELSPEFIQKLTAATGGNTLFVLESLLAILEGNPQADFSTSTEIPLSRTLVNLIQHRISQLNPATLTVLETAAILGSEFDVHTLIQVSLLPGDTIVQALEDLEKRSIIQAIPTLGGHTQYQFIHDKFWEALLDSMSVGKTTTLHARVADWLSESYRPEQAGILAHHKQAAGNLAEAFHYWKEAGIYARSLFAQKEAQDAFSEAGNLIPLIETELSDQDIYQLYDPWCEIITETLDTKMVYRLSNQLLELGKKRFSPFLIGTAFVILCEGALMENKFQEGLEYANQAIRQLEKSGNLVELIEAHINRGIFLYMQNQFKPAIATFDKALALGGDHTGPHIERALTYAHYNISLLHTLAGWPERGLEHAKLAMELAEKNRLHYYQTCAYFGLTLSSYYLADFYQAQNYCRAGMDLSERVHSWRMLGYLTGFCASIDLSLGAIDTALVQSKRNIELGEKTVLNDVIAMGCRHAGDVFNRLHDPETAIQYYSRGFESAGEHFLGLDNLIRLGYVQCMYGELETGHQTLATTLALSQSYELGLGIIFSEFFQSLAYLRQGEFTKARLLATKVKNEAKQQNLLTYHYDAIAVLASISLEEGDLETARDLASIAADEAQLRGNVWSELNARTLLSQIYQRMNHPDNTPSRRIQAIMATLRANTSQQSLVDVFTEFERSYYGL